MFSGYLKMFENSFKATTSTSGIPITEEVEQLRQDATKTAVDIIDGVQTNFASHKDFSSYHEQLEAKLNNITDIIENISQRLNSSNPEPQGYERFDTPRLLLDTHEVDNNSSITNYDLDRDVIMKDKIFAPLIQVPESGFFSGKPSETELFCQLYEDF